MRRVSARALLAAGLALAVLHTIVWLAGIVWLETAIGNTEAGLRAQGWRVDHGGYARGGWPFAARLSVPDLRLVEGGRFWQSAGFEVAFEIGHPTRIAARLSGPHILGLPGATPMPISGPPVVGEFGLLAPYPARLLARELRVHTAAGSMGLDAVDLTAEDDPGHGPPLNAALVRGTVAGVDLSNAVPASALPGRIERIALDAGITGLATVTATPQAWRAAGGQVSIHRLTLHWGGFDGELGGIFGLDSRLQPEGSGMIAAGGLPETIDAAVGAGIIPAGTARTAKALLRLVPRTPDGKLTVPLALKDRTVSAARLPVVVLPEIVWR